jgi:hypothetical protein
MGETAFADAPGAPLNLQRLCNLRFAGKSKSPPCLRKERGDKDGAPGLIFPLTVLQPSQ